MNRNRFYFPVVAAVVVIFQLITVNPANAQFSLGLKVAGNAANYKDLTAKNFGLEAGVFMRFGHNFFFQPEVNYVFKNSDFQGALSEFSSNVKLKQHYISVPALLGYNFINKNNFKFRLTVGPRFDFKISDNISDSGWETNSLQWGGQAGVGIDVWRFTLDVSYCIAADNFHNIAQNTSMTKHLNMFVASLGFKLIK